MTASGISHRSIAETPIAIVDIETTGLYPVGDRVIEIAVVRMDPGCEPKVLLDTLINPKRPVAATEIHGITDADVADAPSFDDVAPLVVEALSGSVFASYNVYFDSKFVREELRRVGVAEFPPHLCLMYMRPMLGLGRKCSLRDACHDSGVPHASAHQASADALAAAALWTIYLRACQRSGVHTFGQLARLKSYKFTSSFADALLDELDRLPIRTGVIMKSRASTPSATLLIPSDRSSRQPILAAYWEALMAAFADLDMTPYEIFYVKSKQSALGILAEELRWLHARAFSGVLADMCQDKAITDHEATSLSSVAAALRELGWSPGDEPAGRAGS